jgi:hypothetical protein
LISVSLVIGIVIHQYHFRQVILMDHLLLAADLQEVRLARHQEIMVVVVRSKQG